MLAFSAGITRGLIEAFTALSNWRSFVMFSAGITRGLIEAGRPLVIASASAGFSAGITRGLIEAWAVAWVVIRPVRVFRGDYPRPH